MNKIQKDFSVSDVTTESEILEILRRTEICPSQHRGGLPWNPSNNAALYANEGSEGNIAELWYRVVLREGLQLGAHYAERSDPLGCKVYHFSLQEFAFRNKLKLRGEGGRGETDGGWE